MDVDQTGAAAPGGDAMEVEPETASDKIFDEMLAKAKALEVSNFDGAVAAYKEIITNKADIEDPNCKGREKAILTLGAFYAKHKKAKEITVMSLELRPLLSEMPKAKAAKVVRQLIDLMSKIPEAHALQIDLCRDCIEWCKSGKRTFLRQRVETRLASLLLVEQKYDEALSLLAKLLSEVKKLDDKMLLVEIYLIECRTHFAVENITKSKASLTAAKTNANAIHCPPLLQADIDEWSGIVCMREKDFRTSYSYFYEAFEAFNAAENELKARTAFKFMLLSKIMHNRPQDTTSIINSKNGLKYAGVEVDAMAAVVVSLRDRSLKKFEQVLIKYKAQLSEDAIIAHHLTDLNEKLVEENINRILEPFSRVEIAHVAELIELPLERTQQKLREMILDGKLNGTLDQGVGVLIVFEKDEVRSTYKNALTTIKNTSDVLDTLYGMAKSVSA